MPELVQYHHVGTSAVLTLNRSEKRNALSRELIAELGQAVTRAAEDSLARSIILTGNGPAFCAGMDLSELKASVESAQTPEMIWNDAQNLSQLYEQIYTLPKPTIAAVNGAAVAGGAGLVTVCDIAIATPEGKFGYPEVRRGLVAAMVLPHLLRHVNERAARMLLLTGDIIDAESALQMGLITEIAPAESLMAAALRYSNLFAEAGPKALATTKELLRRCSHQAISTAELAHASAEPRLTDECRGGLAAFFENRPAPWASTDGNS